MARDFNDDIVGIPTRAGWTKTVGGKCSHEKWIDADKKARRHRPPFEKSAYRERSVEAGRAAEGVLKTSTLR
jgi:hypothetical protein